MKFVKLIEQSISVVKESICLLKKQQKLHTYIKLLREQSFEGWSQDAQDGYLTALTSVQEKMKELGI